MRILLITLDITAPNADTKQLYEALKTQGTWWHYMKSMWLVHTNKTVLDVAGTLTPHVRGKGLLFVTELHRPYQGLLGKDAWEWINSRVDKKV